MNPFFQYILHRPPAGWIIRFMLVVAAFACLRAEPPRTPRSTEPKPATLRFLFLDETAGAYSLKTGAAFRQLSSAPYVISPPYTPAETQRLELYKTGAAPDPKTGEFPRVKVAAITPPAGIVSALVIITPRATAPDSTATPAYEVELVDSSPSTFPGGSLRILNRGRVPMAARLAKDQLVTEPGQTKIISPVADQRGRLRVLVAVQTPDQWRLIDDNVIVVRPDNRVTGVLVYSPSGMKFRLGPYITAERGDPPPSHVWLTYTDTP